MTTQSSEIAAVLVDGRWQDAVASGRFTTIDPASGEPLGVFPVSPWSVIDEALEAGTRAYKVVSGLEPGLLAVFLDELALLIETNADVIVETARRETALPVRPRLSEVELPRTTNQLRQAAGAVRDRTWKTPILSPGARIGSLRAPLPGVVCVFGPNNFPFAFNGIGGGDFAAAVATGHPVIAKGNPGHPEVTRVLAELTLAASDHAGLPPAFVQLIYRTSHEDGGRLVADPRVAATAYTGSRSAGLALKSAADAAGKPIYLEMSSINPIVVLPGALAERGAELAVELSSSMLAGAGQFCTSPGLIVTVEGPGLDVLRRELKEQLEVAPSGTLLGPAVQRGLEQVFAEWQTIGASILASAESPGPGCSFRNSMMEVPGSVFLRHQQALQKEAFGNLSLLVVAADADELAAVVGDFEGNLTGSIYSSQDGDEALYQRIEPILRERVGRLLNDKAPTGVAVVAGMNHGGPYPSTGQPGFTAVGIPTSLERFAMLQSYDAVRDHRLPPELQAANPLNLQRLVEGRWTTAPVVWGT